MYMPYEPSCICVFCICMFDCSASYVLAQRTYELSCISVFVFVNVAAVQAITCTENLSAILLQSDLSLQPWRTFLGSHDIPTLIFEEKNYVG